eukprot:5906474-Pyramimonas_sp.AAC.1
MCAARRREPHSEKQPRSIRETLTTVYNECARHEGESHILKTTRPPSVKLLSLLRLQNHKW